MSTAYLTAFYAAQRLRADAPGEHDPQILAAISQAINTIWLSPAAAYMAAELLAALQTSTQTGIRETEPSLLHSFAVVRTKELEHWTDIATALSPIEKSAERTWNLLGDPPWMLGLTGKPGDVERVLVVVRAREVLERNQATGGHALGISWRIGGRGAR